MTNGNEIVLRRARPDEAEQLKDIGVRGWETTYQEFVAEHNRRSYLNSDFWSIERLKAVLGDQYAMNLAAEQEGLMIGFITTEKLDDDRYEVTRLYVDPDIRSKGVGGRMLQSVFDELRTRGVSEVLVNVFGDNHAGRRFYERHGFELTEDTWCMVGDQKLSDVWYAQRLSRRE
jgi:ribosomal protein S18 acetylase RimI-like enzyme